MKTLNDLTKCILAFRDARDWKQFHTPKEMAISLMLESAEVNEIFQWKGNAEIEERLAELRPALSDELADVLYWVLLVAHDCGIDLVQAMESKMAKNEAKYPVEKAKGSAKKYTEI